MFVNSLQFISLVSSLLHLPEASNLIPSPFELLQQIPLSLRFPTVIPLSLFPLLFSHFPCFFLQLHLDYLISTVNLVRF